MPQRSYIDLIRRYAAQPTKRKPPGLRGFPTIDGGMLHLIYGGGLPHHALRTGEIHYIGHAQPATPIQLEPLRRRRPRQS